MSRNLDTVKGLLLRTNPLQRVAIGAAVVALLAGTIMLFTSGSNQQRLHPLYTDLSSGDAASVVASLADRNITYELSDAGQTILVPFEQVYDLRLQLAGEGLPAQNDGYALLDEQGITTSEFRQRTAYQRALEGELENTIEAINGVAQAVVHLALPNSSAFIDEPGNPTASVLVRTTGVSKLSPRQVEGIVYLVSSSVRDMTPDDVTVTDADGLILHAKGNSALGAGGDMETEFEQRLEDSLMTLVSRVAGAKASVQVTAQLNNDQVSTISERYTQPVGVANDTDTGLVSAEQTTEEDYTGVTPGNETVLGPDGAPVANDNGDATVDYLNTDGSRTYLYDKVIEEVLVAPGAVERLNIAVVVDQDAVAEADVENLQALVAAAAGFDEDRGDQVVVTRMPFTDDAEERLVAAEEAQAAREAAAQRMALIRTAVIALVVLVAMVLAYRSVRRARQVVVETIDVTNITGGGETVAETPAASTTVVETAEEARDEEVEFDIVRAENEAQLQKLVDMQPEAVAQVLRTWLHDGGR